jgi:hypothetical protein
MTGARDIAGEMNIVEDKFAITAIRRQKRPRMLTVSKRDSIKKGSE